MNIAQAKQQVRDTVEAYLEKDEMGMFRIDPSKQRPVFLVGAPGIGKTAIMTQVAQELGVGMVSYSMTHHTRQSALGLPFIVKREYKGFSYECSEYTMSEIVGSIYDYMASTGIEQGVLFLDEINCVSETLYPSMLQFLQFKTFGCHRVPEGWIIVCAGNPPEYNKSVHEFDVVTLDRLRKIEIEPDYSAWHDYAINHGVHPAILSFLDVKKDCFYRVENTPAGKIFVTARGWEDLSELIMLFERLGKPVDKTLVQQFIQHDEVAERFAIYYELFNKYRSDYQVQRILKGEVSEEVRVRAAEAKFDERLSLVGLLLDGISQLAGDAILQNAVCLKLRNILRGLKPAIVDGADAYEALDKAVLAREEDLRKYREHNVIPASQLRLQQVVIVRLREIRAACLAAGAQAGPEAFAALNEGYGALVAQMKEDAIRTTAAIDNTFAFLDGNFDASREGLVFVTELTARKATMTFIGTFGCDSYYAHNKGMLVKDNRADLMSRINQLDLAELAEMKAQEDADNPETPSLRIMDADQSRIINAGH